MSDLVSEYAAAFFAGSDAFDHLRAEHSLAELRDRCLTFAQRAAPGSEPVLEFVAEARYRHQVWQLDVPLPGGHLGSPEDLGCLVEAFHTVHEQVYAVRDERAAIEVVNLRARVVCPLGGGMPDSVVLKPSTGTAQRRPVFFGGGDAVDAELWRLDSLAPGVSVCGPAIVESSFTTIVIEPGASAVRSPSGSLVLTPHAEAASVDASSLAVT